MKIYLFNPETGAYLGEDFADEASMKRGEFAIPPDATTIAPPPFAQGEVPVFKVKEDRWEIRPIFGGGGDPGEQANLQPKCDTYRRMY